jgi:hypothetical protein
MDRVPKVHDAGTDRPSLPDKNVPGEPAESVRRRQAAASYLRAARLTEDAAERESLRRQAAELLSPPRGR